MHLALLLFPVYFLESLPVPTKLHPECVKLPLRDGGSLILCLALTLTAAIFDCIRHTSLTSLIVFCSTTLQSTRLALGAATDQFHLWRSTFTLIFETWVDLQADGCVKHKVLDVQVL